MLLDLSVSNESLCFTNVVRLDNPLVHTESLSTRDVRCNTNVVRLDNPLVLSSS